MEISSFLMILAATLLVGLFLYAPFAGGAKKAQTGASHAISALKAERDRVVSSLQELDFDNALGKVPTEDYPEQRAQLLQRGADILRKLDELTHNSDTNADAESRIEQAAASSAAVTDEDLETLLMARRKEHKSKPAGFCPKCGKPVLTSDQFCPACGKALR